MSRGPQININRKNQTTRDELGIKGSQTNLQEQWCPVVTTVTPRAFYWMYLVWNYYDYFSNVKSDEPKLEEFIENVLRRNDYYFIIANLLYDELESVDKDNLVGKDNCSAYVNSTSGLYEFRNDYLATGTKFGGMSNYKSGCNMLGYTTEIGPNGETYSMPWITEKIGVPMATAFESVIKGTEYYKNYRLNDKSVPKDVLIELGKVLNLKADKFGECKEMLAKSLFQPVNNVLFDNRYLIQTKNYAKMICNVYNVDWHDEDRLRNILYDYFSPRAEERKELSEELKQAAVAWEVIVGRQYFTIAIEIIWKYMLSVLSNNRKLSLNNWIDRCFVNDTKYKFDENELVSVIKENSNYNFKTRSSMINSVKIPSKNDVQCLDYGLKIMLSVLNRFENREDITEDYLCLGGEVSLASFKEKVETENLTVRELLRFVMKDWIIKRHEKVAFQKMLNDKDGYFFEYIDGEYYFIANASPSYQGLRMSQLMSVMNDLDLL